MIEASRQSVGGAEVAWDRQYGTGPWRNAAVRLSTGPGAEIPWHMHSVVNDWYICREGRMWAETRAPESVTDLAPGGMANVRARRPHSIRNVGAAAAAFALVHGVGAYDFHALNY
ncbi:MAG: cupin domain-containing protein [Alphaproteobacteria bacterium]|nr:cupin domain-containing protein [Alphaproteobacteria bacterium]